MSPAGGSLDGRFIAGGIGVEIRGAQAASDKMTQMVTDLRGPGLLRATRDATLLVLRDARINAPVDTGRLRASIAPEVRRLRREVRGVVGSNVLYAPYMELGTGVPIGRPRHWPPAAALETWARRHGIASGWLVARAIGLRGGLEPRKFLQRAVEENRDRIQAIFNRFAGTLARK